MAPAGPRSPIRVGELLGAAVPGLGERMLAERIRAEWPALAGEPLARRARPEGLERGTLTVAADNSPGLHEVALRADELLLALQRRHGSAVSAVRVTLRRGRRDEER